MRGLELSGLRLTVYRLSRRSSRRQLLAEWVRAILYFLWGEKPVPISIIFRISHFGNLGNQVVGAHPTSRVRTQLGNEVNNPELSSILSGVSLGEWSIDAASINFLEKDIMKVSPQAVLEFGSGASTLALALFMSRICGGAECIRVFSVEQDEYYASETERLLRTVGLDRIVKILHAPLTKIEINEVECNTYDLRNIGSFLAGERPDYCLIDGPSVTSFDGRFATLPMIRGHLAAEAQFRMDDAFRDRELHIAKRWQQYAYISISGIIPIGKGLLVGSVSAEKCME